MKCCQYTLKGLINSPSEEGDWKGARKGRNRGLRVIEKLQRCSRLSIAVILFIFEKFDSESKIHIEKLTI